MRNAEKECVNITAITGNGLDLGLLQAIGKRPSELTTYDNYFQWLCDRHFNPENIIYKEMKQARKNGLEDWADLELLIEKLLREDANNEDVIADIDVIRQQFTIFINEFVTVTDLLKVAKLSKNNQLGEQTFSKFTGDFGEKYDYLTNFKKIRQSNHPDYNWNFLNLNYTMLAENYFWFPHNPRPYKKSDNNFIVVPNPVNNKAWTPHTKLFFNFHHPHGTQNVYESLLLGTSSINLDRTGAWLYEKRYAGRLDERYMAIIANTNLFIVFGCSLSRTDKYWWERIIEQMLCNKNCETILYIFASEEDEANLVAQFISNNTHEDVLNELTDDEVSDLFSRFLVKKFDHDNPLQYGFSVGNKDVV